MPSKYSKILPLQFEDKDKMMKIRGIKKYNSFHLGQSDDKSVNKSEG